MVWYHGTSTVRGIHDWSQHFNRRRQLGTYIHKYIYIYISTDTH